MTKRAMGWVMAVFVSFGVGSRTNADVVFNNLDQSDDGITFGSQVGASILTGGTAITLQSVVISQVNGNYDPTETFAIANRNSDGTIGATLLASFTLTHATSGFTTATVVTPFTLKANSGYWFLLNSAAGVPGWDYTTSTTYTASLGVSLPTTNTAYVNNNGGAYYNLADGPQIFQVNGIRSAAVPEPASMLLCGLGCLALPLWTRSRRRPSA